MKLSKLYEAIVRIGIDNDPRGKTEINKQLAKVNKACAKLSNEDKDSFDMETLQNPYADTRILTGDCETNIKNVLVGIDVETPELLLTDTIRQKKKIDLVVSHHPQGIAYAGFYDVMKMQADILGKAGVPISVAEQLTQARMQQVERRVLPANHLRTTDAAKLLNINFICIHTPADNCVATYLQKLIDSKHPETIGDIIEMLKKIPEYKSAILNKAGPKVLLGTESSKCGKVLVEMTGGTEGSKDIFPKLASAGVSTIIGMHISEEHFQKAKQANINVIIAGHISSDNLGLNLLLDAVQKKEKLNIAEFSGFRRVKR
ncbi:MAG TPA: NGG1p interacting factor NIF3 [Candidatus Omnitrophica bacterium]|nr:NGG1p interacting factor NIF3 [Candidatus Omnitrophota bacterium]